MKNDLDKNKLIDLLDEFFFKHEAQIARYGLDINKYKDNSNLIHKSDALWFYGPWTISKKSDLEYNMLAREDYGEGALSLEILFETGAKYSIKKSYIRELWIERTERIEKQ